MRYFYTDPLACAWMMDKFNIRIPIVGAYEHTGNNGDDYKMCSLYNHLYGKTTRPEKYYIRPECFPIFDVRIGDMILDEHRINGVRVMHELQIEQCVDSPIIMRGDVSFIMPEFES